jgi:hypothetical protein
MKSIQLILLALCVLRVSLADTPVNPHAAILQDFDKRVSEYVKLRKTLEGKAPKLKATPSPAEIASHEQKLAGMIRQARESAKQGDIFTPEISAEFRRLIGITMQGADAARIKESLKKAEPVNLRIAVNDVYPKKVPLQSTPPTLLLNLPRLPPELEYRLVGHSLVLRDVKSNLIVDFMMNAMP